ncbi:hypothetical protein [Sodalis-like endosymbiont of Proechinophthirus fluctus]
MGYVAGKSLETYHGVAQFPYFLAEPEKSSPNGISKLVIYQ